MSTAPVLGTSKVAAFFDFDGTVIDGYSAVALLKERALHGQIGLQEALRLTLAGLGAMTGHAEVEDFMRVGVGAFRGKQVVDLDQMGDKLTKSVLGGFLYPEAVERIAHHRKQGHLVVLASSALPFQVEPLARELGVDHVVCTRVGVVDGVCTGEVDGPMLWGPAKAAAVRALAEREGIDLSQSFGYANGDEDIDFLQAVGHPTAVNPGKLLEAVARHGEWPVERYAPKAKGSRLDLPRTVAAYSGLAASCVIGAGLGLLNGSRRVAANTSLSVGSEVALSLAGVSVEVQGEQHLWENRPAVFLFNHQSLLDPLVVFKLLQRNVTSVGKKEVSRTPLVGQFAWLINAALVDRADVTKAKEALLPAVERLQDGYSIVIAPEGTRSITAAVGPFKRGPFHLAIQGGVPVVPIVLRNTGELQWRGSKVIRSGTVQALVLPPIDVSTWDPANLGPKVDAVRQLYVDALADWPTTP
jgi:HAD superfamily hydrolase (TIGR01490 family)